MNKLSTFVNGMTKTKKILAVSVLVALVAVSVVGTMYGVKHLQAKKVA